MTLVVINKQTMQESFIYMMHDQKYNNSILSLIVCSS